eukprot:TRINITY_DN66180_c2_g2_i6.p1 TRINITY_DN66180_c2_g2~~TRINITY_DN66180_c2_g2_i6.p1  ORF type:complete len:223 (+),score=26.64 TRINITY_DN66180_c2_g2_i6:37-705(+)
MVDVSAALKYIDNEGKSGGGGGCVVLQLRDKTTSFSEEQCKKINRWRSLVKLNKVKVLTWLFNVALDPIIVSLSPYDTTVSVGVSNQPLVDEVRVSFQPDKELKHYMTLANLIAAVVDLMSLVLLRHVDFGYDSPQVDLLVLQQDLCDQRNFGSILNGEMFIRCEGKNVDDSLDMVQTKIDEIVDGYKQSNPFSFKGGQNSILKELKTVLPSKLELELPFCA